MRPDTLFALVLITCLYNLGRCQNSTKTTNDDGFYALKARLIESHDHKDTISRKQVKFEKYRGKVVLIVNVASECMFSHSHYQELVKMYNTINKLPLDCCDETGWKPDETPILTEPEDSYFTILGFPCDQFGDHLESAVEEMIDIYTRYRYGVLFPMFEKVECKGENAHPVWKFITNETKVKPEWNFYKYLIDHTGKVVGAYNSPTSIDSLYGTILKYVNAAKEFQNKIQSEFLESKQKEQKIEAHEEL